MADSCVKKSKPREGACRSEKMLTRRSSDADLRHFLFLKVINAPEAARVSAVISTPRSAVAGAVSVFIGVSGTISDSGTTLNSTCAAAV